MSESAGNGLPNTEDPQTVAWGLWRRNQQDRQNLGMRVARKALDIPEEMQIDARKTIRGISTGCLIGAIVASSLPALAMAGVMLWQQAKQQPATPTVEKQVWRGKLRVGWSDDGEPKVDESESEVAALRKRLDKVEEALK